jgi:hypothetical protein
MSKVMLYIALQLFLSRFAFLLCVDLSFTPQADKLSDHSQ